MMGTCRRRGGRAADCTGLENQQRRKAFEGSNPSPSASRVPVRRFSLGLAGSSGGPVVRYLRSYLFVFDSRNWVVNLLFVILCLLIPIIGAIVVIGYFFEVIES